jgi:hypothetical protein
MINVTARSFCAAQGQSVSFPSYTVAERRNLQLAANVQAENASSVPAAAACLASES